MQEFAAGKFHFEPSFTSFDHLVNEQLNRVRHLNAECPCRLQVDDELELAGLQNRQVGGLRAHEDSTGVDADLMPRVQTIGPITHQPSDLGKFTIGLDRGNRPGAGGNLGTEAVVRAPPDGYTLALIGAPTSTRKSMPASLILV
jgi:hypothetical protein